VFEGHDLSSLGVIQRLVWCGRSADGLLNRSAKELGFRRRGDYEVLALLRRSEPTELTPADVASELLVSPSVMTGRIDRLEEQGLLKRKPDTVDRRAVRLSLTDQGRVQVNVAFLANLAIYDQILASFDVRDRAELERLLGRLLEGLRATSQASNR